MLIPISLRNIKKTTAAPMIFEACITPLRCAIYPPEENEEKCSINEINSING